jgi:2-polyprenyl-6-methoxyphenol hydroxylase-like FAD-dependent oxidoreductase
MLLARRGLRVLLLDRAPAAGTDTLSTHALMRAGVLQLSRWGLLDRLVAAGTPPVRRVTFHYGDDVERVELKPKPGVPSLFAPRRTVLDPILVAAAAEAGVEVRYGAAVGGLLWQGGRVAGVAGTFRDGGAFEVRAPLVVGADGVRSRVAEAAGAECTWRGGEAGACIYGYWPAHGEDGYEWFYRPGVGAGVIPTDGGQVCVWASASAGRFLGEYRGNPERAFDALFAEGAPEAVSRFPRARRDGRLRGFAGVRGFVRRASGAGWALVGDAGTFRDPISAHGITDALRDAELLADAAAAALGGGGDAALAAYGRRRDEVTMPMATLCDEIAGYRWTLPEVRELLMALSKEMGREAEMVAALDPVVCDPVAHDAAARAVA